MHMKGGSLNISEGFPHLNTTKSNDRFLGPGELGLLKRWSSTNHRSDGCISAPPGMIGMYKTLINHLWTGTRV